MPPPRIVTLGCRLNTSESEAMKALSAGNLDDVIIVNTCAVTTEAERQARQTIRHLRKENPSSFIIATGCAVELRPHAFVAMEEVDRIVGNGAKIKEKSFASEAPRIHMDPIEASSYELPLPSQESYQSKAFVQVQNGCNHFCTFCTIVLARGRSRSASPDSIVRHIEALMENGVKEVILTGVDMTSYQWEQITLADLLILIMKRLPHLSRIRLSSLDSMEVTPSLLDLLCHESRILPHLHLSLQSGSNFVLKAMKRRHSREQAIDLCQTLKKSRQDIALGADFITGFPGETQDMFEETMALVDDCSLTHLHVFPFSPRPGTLAARMKNQISSILVKERAALLRQKGEERLGSWLAEHVGKKVTFLAETAHKGHTDNFSVVYFTEPIEPHTLGKGKVVGASEKNLLVAPSA